MGDVHQQNMWNNFFQCRLINSDVTETYSSPKQYIYEVKAWFYHHCLLRYQPERSQHVCECYILFHCHCCKSGSAPYSYWFIGEPLNFMYKSKMDNWHNLLNKVRSCQKCGKRIRKESDRLGESRVLFQGPLVISCLIGNWFWPPEITHIPQLLDQKNGSHPKFKPHNVRNITWNSALSS